MNTPRTSVSFLAMSTIVALALGVLPQTAAAAPPQADAPKSGSKSGSRSEGKTKPQPKSASKTTAKPKPKAKPTRSLDATAARALRSSSRKNASAPRGERIAMRTAAAPAEADPPKRGKSKKKATKRGEEARAPASDADRDADRQISLDEDFLVEGKLEKPNAFFILRRSQSGYDWARLDAKFLPLVLESVQDPLF